MTTTTRKTLLRKRRECIQNCVTGGLTYVRVIVIVCDWYSWMWIKKNTKQTRSIWSMCVNLCMNLTFMQSFLRWSDRPDCDGFLALSLSSDRYTCLLTQFIIYINVYTHYRFKYIRRWFKSGANRMRFLILLTHVWMCCDCVCMCANEKDGIDSRTTHNNKKSDHLEQSYRINYTLSKENIHTKKTYNKW